MDKIYSSDREICSLFFEDSLKDSRLAPSISADFLESLSSLFDRNGYFIPQQLKETYLRHEDLFLSLARSEQREFRFLGTAGLLTGEREDFDPLLWEAFYDCFYPVRGLVVDFFQKKERARLFNEIFRKLTGDPRQVIRERAFRRIRKDFSDLFSFRINSFTPEEQYRLLLFLDGKTTQDKGILNEFLEVGSDDLASRALYRLQKDSLDAPLIWAERSKELNLIRYGELSRFCHSHLEQFPQVFSLLSRKTPPSLVVQFVGELLRHPHNENWSALYDRSIELIGHLRDSRIGDLITGIFKNQGIRDYLGPDIARMFTRENQYFSAPLLARYFNSEENPRIRKALKSAGDRFSFPCFTGAVL